MPDIRLHNYVTKIKGLIQDGRHEEAIAHCQHILSHYPKHVETYCLLGEACLEKGMYREAIEFFQRTLSADPESFIARVGLGIIYDGQGALSEAIWQMERAFELAPGNAEVRREMQRLYAQRDGAEKTRLKLTRGALGWLYSRNGLYERAISEFHGVLDQDPDLPDVQVALVEALWREGRRLEAVETSLELLDALPYCLKANLILGEIWTMGGHEDAGEEKLQVAQALDPENRVAQEMMGKESPLPAREVLIPELEAVPGALALMPMAEKLSAEWSAPEDRLAEPEETELAAVEEVPGALLEPVEEAGALTEEDFFAGQEVMAAGLTEEEVPSEEAVPDWLQELVDEEVSLSHEEVTPASAVPEGEFPEEVPGWLRETEEPAPLGIDLPAPGVEEGETEGVEPAEEAVPSVPSLEQVPESLRALVVAGILDESDLAAAMAEMSEEEIEAQHAEEVPEWLRDLAGEEGPAAEVAPAPPLEEEAAMPPLGEVPASLLALVAAGILDESDLDAAMAEMSEEEVEAQRAEEVPEWLRDLVGEEGPAVGVALAPALDEEAPVPPAEEPVLGEEVVFEEEEVEELAAWLQELEPAAAETTAEARQEEAAAEEEQVEELPAWLQELEPASAETTAEARLEEAAAEEEEVEELPAWLQELEPAAAETTPEAGVPSEAALVAATAEMAEEEREAPSDEDLPEWLRDLLAEEVLAAEQAPGLEPEEEVIEPPREEVPEERVVEPSAAAVPEELTEAEEIALAEEAAVAEEALVLEELVFEPPPAMVEEAEVLEVEQEEAEPVEAIPGMPVAEAAPPADMEMVAPYDRVEVEEEMPARRRIDDLGQQLKANPRDHALRLELARLHRGQRDWDPALTHYQNLISARKFLPFVLEDLDLLLQEEVDRPRVYQLMGDAYLQQNKLDKSLQMYRLAQQALTKR